MSILFVLSLLSTSQLLAQTYEWAPQGAKWWYRYNVGLSGYETTYTMEAVGDTMIQNVTCKILRQELVDFRSGISDHVTDDFIYQSGDTVFYYSRGQSKFSILYNFDAPLTDSITILEPGDPFSVDSTLRTWKIEVDTITLGNQTIRRYTSRSNLAQSEWGLFGSLYEVIGNVDGFFLPLYGRGCDGGCPGPLRCYKDDKFDVTFGTAPCDFVTSAILQKRDDVNIYPNPATSSFFHSASGSDVQEIKIYDFFGREQTINYRGPQEIDISSFYPGAYWIYLRTRSGMEVTKLIVL